MNVLSVFVILNNGYTVINNPEGFSSLLYFFFVFAMFHAVLILWSGYLFLGKNNEGKRCKPNIYDTISE